MHRLIVSAAALLAGIGLGVVPGWSPPYSTGPCASRLQQLGYRAVELDAEEAHSSLYEARRGRDQVKLMVKNGSCLVERVWLDE
ncbi:hypothetical protein [Vulcanococcus sp.]|jgi:hypothetical protein|uniref:hypothetical protein n=1 Tax=Vulcanococcus sp. TaxID=2856995 RepID=UPI0037D9ED23